MFVQDDQIRFAARDQRVVRCGAGERAASCTARRSADVGCRDLTCPWHIVRVGSAGCVELLLSVLFPFLS